jgi:hypothetical protein
MSKTSQYYTRRTLNILFGQSSHCAFPGCTQPLVAAATDASEEAVLALVCHIIAARDKGPRGDPGMDAKARNQHGNLLLMCGAHHVLVDKQHETYPAPLLRLWKTRQQRETACNLAPYRAAIARHLTGEIAEGALFRRRPGAAPVAPRLQTEDQKDIVADSLQEIATRLDRPIVAIIGRSGAGKTTLLHQLGMLTSQPDNPHSGACGGALPLLVNCSRFAGSLPALIASEARNTTGITIDLDGMQGLDFPVTLYCDDFQYCPDKKVFIEQLRAFTHQFRGARCILFTHDLVDSGVWTSGVVPAYRIADLDDDSLLDLFAGFMDVDAAETLLDEMATRGELDAIRQPVLAALVAVAYVDAKSDQDDQPISLRRGELLRRVIRDGVLRSWIAQRSSDLSSLRAKTALGGLAKIAAALVREDTEFFTEAIVRGDTAGSSDVGAAIEIGLSCGLLRRREGEIGFAHAALRDYLAAEWLLTAPPRRVAVAWFSTRWHGALRNFASIWPVDPRRLFWLRLSGWISLRLITILRVAPNSFATRLFYLMLEFAAESQIDEPWLRYGVFERYRRGYTFLDETAMKPHRLFIGPWEDKIADVYRLFGRLCAPEIDAWLRSGLERRYAIHGIRQDTSERGLETLLRSVGADDDGLADEVTIELAFEYPSATLRKVFDRLRADSAVHHGQLLHAIDRVCRSAKSYEHLTESASKKRRNRVQRALKSDLYWRDTTLPLFLEADDHVSRSALSLLRCLDNGWALRGDVEKILIDSASSTHALTRQRAASGLVYGRNNSSIDVLKRLLSEDEDSLVCAGACQSLLYRDIENCPAYYLLLLRRWGTIDPQKRNAERTTVTQVVSIYALGGHKPFKKYVRAFLTYLRCGASTFERMVASDALYRIRGRAIADALRAQIEREAMGRARHHIAEHWAMMPDVTTDEAVTYLLASPEQELRLLACAILRRRRDAPSAELHAMLENIAVSDAYPELRTDLGRYLSSFGHRQDRLALAAVS